MKNVLMVDDEPDTLKAYATILKTEGFNVVVCNSMDAAIPFIYSRIFDIYIIDKSMPGGRHFGAIPQTEAGLTLYNFIRQDVKDRDSGIIVLSNYPQYQQDHWIELLENDVRLQTYDKLNGRDDRMESFMYNINFVCKDPEKKPFIKYLYQHEDTDRISPEFFWTHREIR
jgi:CheY-like chemotaxis protein